MDSPPPGKNDGGRGQIARRRGQAAEGRLLGARRQPGQAPRPATVDRSPGLTHPRRQPGASQAGSRGLIPAPLQPQGHLVGEKPAPPG